MRGHTKLHPEVPPEHRGSYLGLTHPAVIEHLRRTGVTAGRAAAGHLDRRRAAAAGPQAGQLLGLRHARLPGPARRLRQRPGRRDRGVHRDGVGAARRRHRGDPGHGAQPHRGGRGGRHHAELPRAGRAGLLLAWAATGSTPTSPAPATPWTPARPTVLRLVCDAMRHWVTRFGVDGFRIDLASVLGRPRSGPFDPNAPLLMAIATDPVLSRVKLIAEPWDATGEGYRVGGFGVAWSEWNGRYRDAVRDFWRGHGPDRRGGVPADRQLRPVQAVRPPAVGVDQLRHRARRFHPARPAVLRAQAQRGQRRGQPRRHRRQPLAELRRRGRHHLTGDPRPAGWPPPGPCSAPCCCPPAPR